ncbi:unnamed protein product [Alternaria alternata]
MNNYDGGLLEHPLLLSSRYLRIPAKSSTYFKESNPVPNMGYYLERHPEIAFAIYKGYDERPPEDFRELVTTDGLYRSPRPTTESLSLIAPAMLDAVDQLIQHIPRFDDYFPNLDLQEEIPAPYMFMYYSAPFISELLPRLDIFSQDLIRQLKATIEQSHGSEYESAKLQAEKGRVTHNHLDYLFRPGDVLVSNGADGHAPQAYIATGWVQRRAAGSGNKQEKSSSKHGNRTNGGPSRKSTQYIWDIPVWYWDFDGSFAKHQTRIDIVMSLGYEEDSIRIRDLNIYPIRYADEEIRTLLEKRGKTFWSLRHRKFISYMRSEGDELYNIEDRYMVDTEAYKMICPDTKIAQQHLRNAFGAVAMALDEPPEERDVLLVVPTTIMAHNLEEKQWSELLVDRITDVTWNKQAFKDLVAEPETKELVQALVMKRLNAKRSTDFVAGKGNGLIMLLHGAPGTGKTFTAEGVAEFAEKPLLRVTCGDIGTDAEVVDQRLRATFRLGKLWDCVVLLDEADVFLEERDMKDLKRNALVSVFLRALEYYDGILILTSNRVGTFDEAFKSRIQLALHYDNLGFIQRKKIWRNFIARMKTLEESSITDLEDILDHIDELSKEPMNGREIRNAITIARQLAQFREQCFQYSHLKHAISVGNRFSKYLKDLRMNLTDDMIKQEDGIRLAPAGLE